MTYRSFLVAFCLFLSAKLSAEPPEVWANLLLPIGEYEGFSFSFWQEYRFLFSNFKLVNDRYSLQVKRTLTPLIDGEVHYTLINSRGPNQIAFYLTRRWELELNPKFPITKNLQFKLRNRYEFLDRDVEPTHIQKFRQRQQLTYQVEGRLLSAVAFHNEVFYNVTTNKIDEDRLVPVELQFKSKGHTYKTACMIRWLRPADIWSPQFVVVAGIIY